MSKVLFDFTDPHAASAWRAIDDRVMGGISRSTLRQDRAGHAVFEGSVSLERDGGFASVRSSPGEHGLPDARTCLIELRGDHKQFKLSLLTDDGFDSLNYQASFAPAGADWQTLHLPVAHFRASFRGREVSGAPALDPARIRQVGLMIAARQAGPFELHIRRISLARKKWKTATWRTPVCVGRDCPRPEYHGAAQPSGFGDGRRPQALLA